MNALEPVPLNRTESALMARNVDSQTARQLRKDGWTLERLKQRPPQELRELGLEDAVVDAILSGVRPSIPLETLISVLFKNRFVCCVCRDPKKSIVVHHISPWSESGDHSSSNLAVLCLDHHGEAHTTRELALTLNEQRLRRLKDKWETEVETLDRVAILDASQIDYDAWYYFNHKRLFELASEVGVAFTDLSMYRSAYGAGTVDEAGMLRPRLGRSSYMYSGLDTLAVYAYVREVVDYVLPYLRITNISDHLDRGTLPNLLVPGDFIFVQGAHSFASVLGQDRGPEQLCKGTRLANHVEVSYVFNRWEATSDSAWGLWLRGRQVVGSLIQVKNVGRLDGKLRIKGTVFAICAPLQGLKRRNYAPPPYLPSFERFDEDDCDLFDNYFGPDDDLD